MRGLLRVAAFAILLLAAAGCDGLTSSTGSGAPGSVTIGSGPGPDPAWSQALTTNAAPNSDIAVNHNGQALVGVATQQPGSGTDSNLRLSTVSPTGSLGSSASLNYAGNPSIVYTGLATNGNAWVVAQTLNAGHPQAEIFLASPAGQQLWQYTVKDSQNYFVDAEDATVDPNTGALYVFGETGGNLDGQHPVGTGTLWLGKFAPGKSVAWLRQYQAPTNGTAANFPLQVAYEPQGGGHMVGVAFQYPTGNSSDGVMPVAYIFDPGTGALQVGPSNMFTQPSVTDRFSDMAAAPNGDLYLVGGYSPGPTSDSDFLIVHCDYSALMAGNPSYLSYFRDGSTANDDAFAVTVGASGTIYVAGFSDAEFYGYGFWQNQHGRGDAVVAAYTLSNGSIQRKWATMFNAGFSYGVPLLQGITTDPQHGLYVVGYDMCMGASGTDPNCDLHTYPNFVTRFAIPQP